jgi:hypothetical protein
VIGEGHVRRAAQYVLVVTVLAATGIGTACAEIGLGPNEAAAIELDPFPSPSVVVGDTLRTIDGVVAPVRARVFNVRGDVISDAAPRYLYADANIDSALAIDSATGIVVAKALVSGDKRIAARIGGTLQVLRGIRIVPRPDSVSGTSLTEILGTTLPDTGRQGQENNSTKALSVTVRHRDGNAVSPVRSWPVRFQLVSPANPTNDTMAAVYLVDDQGRASVLDTTDDSGAAGRRVRVRALQFPVGAAVESVVVRATVTYRGQPLKGSPVRITAPVRRGAR